MVSILLYKLTAGKREIHQHCELRQILLQVGQRVKRRREELGLSQEDLADAADLHRTYVSLLETGKRNASLLTLCKIAVALNIRLSDLLEDLP